MKKIKIKNKKMCAVTRVCPFFLSFFLPFFLSFFPFQRENNTSSNEKEMNTLSEAGYGLLCVRQTLEEPCLGVPFQGGPYQGDPCQGGPYQGGPCQVGPYQGVHLRV